MGTIEVLVVTGCENDGVRDEAGIVNVTTLLSTFWIVEVTS